MKYAVFSVSMPEYAPDAAVTRLKELGYDGIEWRVIDQAPDAQGADFWARNRATLPFSTFEKDAPVWKALTEAAGLAMPGLGTYVRCDHPDAVESAMRGAVAMGVPQLRVTVPQYDGSEPFLPLWERSQAQYRDVAELARSHGVKALLELHHRTLTPSASAARRFLDGCDPDHVGVIHDIGNMPYEGYETPRMGLEVLGDYLAHVHVKNARWFPTKYREDGTLEWKCDWAPLHKGVIDLRLLFTALRAVGYDGWIGVEDFSTVTPLDQRLTANLAYLKQIEASLAGEAS